MGILLMQIQDRYTKKINIGSAKPKFDKEISKGVHTLNGITHYLYDFVDPKKTLLFLIIKIILLNNVLKNTQGIPILTGGSGLYIDNVVIYNYKLSKITKILI